MIIGKLKVVVERMHGVTDLRMPCVVRGMALEACGWELAAVRSSMKWGAGGYQV